MWLFVIVQTMLVLKIDFLYAKFNSVFLSFENYPENLVFCSLWFLMRYLYLEKIGCGQPQKCTSKLLNVYYRPKAFVWESNLCLNVYFIVFFVWLFSPKKGVFIEEMRCCNLWLDVDVFGEMYCNNFWPCSCVWFKSLSIDLILHWAFINAEVLAFHFMFVCQCN